MKKTVLWLCAVTLALTSCVNLVPGNTDAPSENEGSYTYTYKLSKVLQIDPLNTSGIDIKSYFDWFDSYSLTVYVENGKYAYCEVNTGDIPFNPYGFKVPAGKQACSLDNSVSPTAIRLSSGEVLARYKQGQFVVPFQLDCSDISYEFWFK